MARILASLCLVLAATLSFVTAASAGGWAVTTIDSFPESLVAGVRYEIGYTIRQHGVTPVDIERMGGTTEIRGTSAAGETISFRGARSGPTGHYVASVAVPSAGTWTLDVTQGPFASQKLGVFTVALPAGAAAEGAAPALASASSEGSSSATAPAPTDHLRLALPLASGAAVALFAGILALYLRGTRRERAVPAT